MAGMKCGCLLAAIAIGLIGVGIGGLREAIRFRHPVTMSCAKFIAKPRAEGWYHLTGCRVDMNDATIETSKTTLYNVELPSTNPDGDISAVISPVYPIGIAGKTTPLVLNSSDLETTLFIEKARSMLKSEKDGPKWLLANQDKLCPTREITGMIEHETSNESSDKERNPAFAPGYVMLTEGARPESPNSSIGLLITGLVFGALTILYGIIYLHQLSRTPVYE